jgi:hypothetical protein
MTWAMKRIPATSRIEMLHVVRKGADTIEVRVVTYPEPLTAGKRPNGV